MKKCPVCNSRLFDDMDVCYNCLHHFEDIGDIKEEYVDSSGVSFNVSADQDSDAKCASISFEMGDFLIAFKNFLDDYFKRIKCA